MARPEVAKSHDAAEMVVESARPVLNEMWDALSAWVAQSGRQVRALIEDVPHLPADLRDRAERVLRDLGTRRTRLFASLESQATGLADGVARRFSFASRDQIADLRARVSEIEQRLDTLARQSAIQSSVSVDS